MTDRKQPKRRADGTAPSPNEMENARAIILGEIADVHGRLVRETGHHAFAVLLHPNTVPTLTQAWGLPVLRSDQVTEGKVFLVWGLG